MPLRDNNLWKKEAWLGGEPSLPEDEQDDDDLLDDAVRPPVLGQAVCAGHHGDVGIKLVVAGREEVPAMEGRERAERGRREWEEGMEGGGGRRQ